MEINYGVAASRWKNSWTIDIPEFKMIRESHTSRERRSTRITEPLEQDDTEGNISAQAVEKDGCAKRGSTPLQKQWTSSEDSSRPYSREIKTVCIDLTSNRLNFILYLTCTM